MKKQIDLDFRNFKDCSYKANRPRRLREVALYAVGEVIYNVALAAEAVYGFLTTSFTVFGVTLTYGQVAYSVLSIGMSIYSMLASGGGKEPSRPPNNLDYNGQLVNTRQASDPLKVVYGIAKSGGTWVFSKVSSTSNNILNNIVTWGEGEVEGIATGIDTSPIYSGSTLNDLETGGEFAYAGCSCDGTCYSYTPCSCNMTCDGYV